MSFAGIPSRSNGDQVFASWFNLLQIAGAALESLLNASNSLTPTKFTIADNQASFANVTGLVFDHTVIRAAIVQYTIYRTDGAIERRETGLLHLGYKNIAGTWTLERQSFMDDALNVASSLQVTSGGQIQYKSDSMGGTYSGFMTFQCIQPFAAES